MSECRWWTPRRGPPTPTNVPGLTPAAETVWQALLSKRRTAVADVPPVIKAKSDSSVGYYAAMYERKFGTTPQSVAAGRDPNGRCASQSSTTGCTNPATRASAVHLASSGRAGGGPSRLSESCVAPVALDALESLVGRSPREVEVPVFRPSLSPPLDLSSDDDVATQRIANRSGNRTQSAVYESCEKRPAGDVTPAANVISVRPSPRSFIGLGPGDNPRCSGDDPRRTMSSRLTFSGSGGRSRCPTGEAATSSLGRNDGGGTAGKRKGTPTDEPDRRHRRIGDSSSAENLNEGRTIADVQLKRFDKILDAMGEKDGKTQSKLHQFHPPVRAKPAAMSSDSSDWHLISVEKSNLAEKEEIVAVLKLTEEVALTLIYDDGSSLLRETNITKKKSRMTMQQAVSLDVAYLRIIDGRPDDHETSLQFVSFSLTHQTGDFYAWSRAVILDLMCSVTRKLCFGAQQLIKTLATHFSYKRATVISDWKVYDPRIASWLLDPDQPPTTFTEVIGRLDDVQLKPPGGTSGRGGICGDLARLGPVMVALYGQLSSRDLWTLYNDLETPLIPLLAVMELRGIHVDAAKLGKFADVLKSSLLTLERRAYACVGRRFLINSHPQLRQILFEELKLESGKGQQKVALTSIGQHRSTGESVLTSLQGQHPLPAIVLEYRQVQKLKSTYVDGVLSLVRGGQLKPTWDQTAAATGRLTAANPNVQAVPKLATIISVPNATDDGRDTTTAGTQEIFVRESFVSRDGYSFLSADFCQIELRLLAHLSADHTLLDVFNRPAATDIFTQLTAQWLGKQADDVVPLERERTKRVTYSILYGAGKDRLAEYLKITADEAKAIMSSFLVMFPGIGVFTRKCVQQARIQGYQTTIFGRRRLLPHISHSNPQLRAQAERQAVNFCVQGSAADLCKAAMLQVERALIDISNCTARLLIQIHDELLLEVPDPLIANVAGAVRQIMESTEGLCRGFDVSIRVPIRIAISTGKSWAHMDAHGFTVH